MARMVWCCGYCSDIFENEFDALEHEKVCGYNTETKKCETCEYYIETGYPISGSDMRCMNKLSKLYNKNVSYHLEDNDEKDYFPCEHWKEDR